MEGSREHRKTWRSAAMAALTTMLMIVVIVASQGQLVAAASSQYGVGGGCPSQGQLADACAQYVVGDNPPVPPPSGACCNLLSGSDASCICDAIPSHARSFVNPQGLKNIRSSCRISFNCPGF
ncbi:hypothetical protein KP509_09G054700 [Ceratopteris richardii]|uniref:Bifunctional inhibitor/plant lipid transfer protein/seed storage helical domain-containing protein n=1 Tax=Ceratopteris richardii TaxID=49495 RepID=A0A8T2U6I9_CERRI|nr:hypothetical protein KP509_09G054700 [Ceratopteris richardii]